MKPHFCMDSGCSAHAWINIFTLGNVGEQLLDNSTAEWMDEENKCSLSNCNESEPLPSTKKHMSLSLKNLFKSTDKDHIQEMSKPKIPPNASVSTQWAKKSFYDCCDAKTLNKWLCVFIYKMRTTSGKCYPPKSA